MMALFDIGLLRDDLFDDSFALHVYCLSLMLAFLNVYFAWL